MHLGAYRNVNSRKLQELGPDIGFDSIGDFPQVRELGSYFDQLEKLGAMPKAVIYNHNPTDNYLFATLAGNFQDGSIPGRYSSGRAGGSLIKRRGWKHRLMHCPVLGFFPVSWVCLLIAGPFFLFPA